MTAGSADVTLAHAAALDNDARVQADDLWVRYVHLEAVLVSDGDQVAIGTVLGLDGPIGLGGAAPALQGRSGMPGRDLLDRSAGLISPPVGREADCPESAPASGLYSLCPMVELPWSHSLRTVQDETLRRRRPRIDKLLIQRDYWLCIGEYILRQFPLAYPDPALECPTEATESIHSASCGFYKTADTVLRREMELALTSVYWSTTADARPTWQELETSTPLYYMPACKKMTKALCRLECFQQYRAAVIQAGHDDDVGCVDKAEIDALYGTISSAIHGHPGAWNVHDWDLLPNPQFSAAAFDAWADLYDTVQHAAFVWLLAVNPEMFRWVYDNRADLTDRVLGPHEIEFFRARPGTWR